LKSRKKPETIKVDLFDLSPEEIVINKLEELKLKILKLKKN
ncbi:MAG: hypothetical protein RLZ10_2391, partial [Bacteroidota bacterium]